MIIQKSEIVPKLSKLKTIVPSKVSTEENQSIQGILYKNNYLQATNLEISIKTTFEKGEEETFIIPARAIDLIENLPEGQIEIIPEQNSIRIKTKGINNVFQTFDPEEFPNTLTEADSECGIINCTDFSKAVNSVIYAVSDKSVKPILGGICFDSKNGKLNIVGCDGYRMAWAKIDYENEFNFVIPKTHLKNVLSLCKSGDIKISCSKVQAVFKTDEFTIYTRLLDGNYIAYENMFIKRDNIAIINRITLLESLKRALINVDDRGQAFLKFNIKNKTMTIMADSSLSKYMEEIELEKDIDTPLDIGFNGLYLMECLKAHDDEILEFNFGTGIQPLIIEESDKLSLVLPIRM